MSFSKMFQVQTPTTGVFRYPYFETTLKSCHDVLGSMQRGYKVKAMTRSKEKANQLLGEKEGLEVIVADAKDPQSLRVAVDGINAVAAVTGTTAFPSKK